ncbi:hypothetical protein [Verrucosispora sioxanthis]|uniref:Uncharacterized protein n=1 Tax=Verrucosispora sioxanthis TaxID=2499994 RepID=A0A6M1L620_9ACTN|nr:hypothetical protein [Verrucosispora sioxanthis]NEE64424.1 hypothetical protein [Verrucosispora sioxanthis]NGM13534.1 hypothetical protein [Verrucosispora sioxanthis]
MTTTTAPRFTNSQRGYLIVCAPVRLTPGVLAHRPSRNVIGGAEDNPSNGARLVFTTDKRWVTTPACQPDPEPDDPNAGRGWAEYTAGWVDHRGALACPTCFPSAAGSVGIDETVEG